MTQLNLDQKAAQYAQQMVNSTPKGKIDTLERLVTKTLGVLQEQGVYAMLLFLYSRSRDEEKVAPAIYNALFRLLKNGDHHCVPGFADKPVPGDNAQVGQALQFYSDCVLNRLDTLLLVRDLYEQTLIYARYGAKAVRQEGN